MTTTIKELKRERDITVADAIKMYFGEEQSMRMQQFLSEIKVDSSHAPFTVLCGLTGFRFTADNADHATVFTRYNAFVYYGDYCTMQQVQLADKFAASQDWLLKLEHLSEFVFVPRPPDTQRAGGIARHESDVCSTRMVFKDPVTPTAVKSVALRSPVEWVRDVTSFTPCNVRSGMGVVQLAYVMPVDTHSLPESDVWQRTVKLMCGTRRYAAYANNPRKGEVQSSYLRGCQLPTCVLVNPRTPTPKCGDGTWERPVTIFSAGFSGLYSCCWFQSQTEDSAGALTHLENATVVPENDASEPSESLL